MLTKIALDAQWDNLTNLLGLTIKMASKYQKSGEKELEDWYRAFATYIATEADKVLALLKEA